MNGMKILIDDIEIGARFRKDFGDLNELALSINSHGQLQPIIVSQKPDGKFQLVAGERRLQAHKMLKRTEIDAVFRSDLTELEKVTLELEENLQRKAFEWPEEVAIKRQIDQLQREAHGEGHGRSRGSWTLQDTADLIGQSKSTVAADVELAKGVEIFPELKKEPNKKAAYKKLKSLLEEEMRKRLAARQKVSGSLTILSDKVYQGDCIEVMKKMPTGTIHLVVTDPPYGIDYDQLVDSDNSAGYTMFEDSRMESLDMIDLMLQQMERVMATDSSIYIFFGITLYTEMLKLMSKYFQVDPMPLIWYKQNLGGGRVTIPEIYQARSYEAILYGRKGNRALVKQGQPNVLAFDVVTPKSKIHPTEKPTALLRELIERSSLQGETVLDACAGSGSTLFAARQIGRDFIGIEKTEHYYNAICQRLTINSPKPGMQSDSSEEQSTEEISRESSEIRTLKEQKTVLQNMLTDLGDD